MLTRFIKKIVIGLFLVSLVGCGNHDYSKTKPYLSKPEKMLLETYYEDYSNSGYDETLLAIRMSRSHESLDNLPEGWTTVKDTDTPFCGVLPALLQEELQEGRCSRKNKEDVSSLWFKLKGVTLEESCNPIKEVVVAVVEAPVVIEEKILRPEQVEIINEVEYLAADKYAELITTVQGCKSAKVKLIMALEGGSLLTTSDYEEITKITLQCAAFTLQVELNK